MGGIPLTRPTGPEAIRLVHHALDLGVNFFDTARGYGISEERFGKAFTEVAERRDSIVIATKGGGDKAGTQRSIEESLRQLQIEAIDVWQFHGVNTFASLDSILGPGGGMEGARQALQAGKIRHIGFSSHSLKVALKGVASGQFETVQFPFNFISNEAADVLVPLAQEHDLGFIAMKPFAGGMIRSANQAIKYLMQFDSAVPDPGIETVDEITEIVGIVDGGSWELTPQEQSEIAEIRARGHALLPAVRVLYALPRRCAHLWRALSGDSVGPVATRAVLCPAFYWQVCPERRGKCGRVRAMRRM
jgi:aryl-alcohol dehydrogenase-like predicted oxidoreductase